MNNEFQHIGANIYSLLGDDEEGYRTSLISLELRKEAEPHLIAFHHSAATRENIEKMLKLIYEVVIKK